MKVIPYNSLENSDLTVDAVYEGGGSVGELGDPISRLLPGCGNLGGFRPAGKGKVKKFVVLFTSGEDKDWPDSLDLNTGRFTYYGDNKKPGRELHDTPKRGNLLLMNIFNWLHSDATGREKIPPFFVFMKYPTRNSTRSVQFKGLAVPGFPGLTATEDLIAVWKTTNNQRFQNYRSTFTILDIATVKRQWLIEIMTGLPNTKYVPGVWRSWKRHGIITPLTSESTAVIRTVESQSPRNELQESILEMVFEHFKETPLGFEAFAAKIFQYFDQRVIVDEITRGAVDGGRDAVGRYLLGLPDDPVYAEFALEAKCYRPPLKGVRANTVGVKEISRLIARLRHRQFGILVTTSVVARQAYEEVRMDKHPVVFICGKDIAEILVSKGFNTPKIVHDMLETEFPQ